MTNTATTRPCNRDVGSDGICNLLHGHAGEHSMRDLKQFLREEGPIELPVTALGEVAELLREAQLTNLHGGITSRRQEQVNDQLQQARLMVDVLRGDGE